MKSLVMIILLSMCALTHAQTSSTQRSGVSELVADSTVRDKGPHCIYNDENAICIRCGQSKCAGSSQESITDCFAAPECNDGDSENDTLGSLAIESPQPVPVQCTYHPSTGACYALTSSGLVPATAPDAQSCAEHCDAN